MKRASRDNVVQAPFVTPVLSSFVLFQLMAIRVRAHSVQIIKKRVVDQNRASAMQYLVSRNLRCSSSCDGSSLGHNAESWSLLHAPVPTELHA